MNALLSREARIAECHDRARESSAHAAATHLEGVREKHEVSAARWLALAALYERGGRDPIIPADEARDVVGQWGDPRA